MASLEGSTHRAYIEQLARNRQGVCKEQTRNRMSDMCKSVNLLDAFIFQAITLVHCNYLH